MSSTVPPSASSSRTDHAATPSSRRTSADPASTRNSTVPLPLTATTMPTFTRRPARQEASGGARRSRAGARRSAVPAAHARARPRHQPVRMRARDTEQPRRLRDTEHQHPTCLFHHDLRFMSPVKTDTRASDPKRDKKSGADQRNRERARRPTSAWSCRVPAGAADRVARRVSGASRNCTRRRAPSRGPHTTGPSARVCALSLRSRPVPTENSDRISDRTPRGIGTACRRRAREITTQRRRDHRLPTRRRERESRRHKPTWGTLTRVLCGPPSGRTCP